MIEIDFVAQLVSKLYDIIPVEIHSLAQFPYEWRGIYWVKSHDDQQWVLRMVRKNRFPTGFQAPSILLPWLAQVGYPAPEVKLTNLDTGAEEYGGWRVLMTKFVPGQLASPTPDNMRLIGSALGQLHQLATPDVNALPSTPESRWYPRLLTLSGFQHPNEIAHQLSSELQYLYREVYQTQANICRIANQLPLKIIHGDCWYGNTLLTAPDHVVFIDWDMGGLGPALLDLGELLLTAHYDAANLLTVEPNQALIYAIMEGYCEYRCLSALEQSVLLDAIRYLLVSPSAWFLEQTQEDRQENIEVRKLRMRYAATERIAQIVEVYLNQVG